MSDLARDRNRRKLYNDGLEMQTLSFAQNKPQLLIKAYRLNHQLQEIVGNLNNFSPLLQRQLGSFYGLIIGDALGAPFEKLTHYPQSSRIAGYEVLFPEPNEYKLFMDTGCVMKGVTSTTGFFASRAIAGMWTDDSAQMLCLSEVLAHYGRVVGAQFHFAIQNWYENAFCTPYSREMFNVTNKIPQAFGSGGTTRGSIQWFKAQNVRGDCKDQMFSDFGDGLKNSNGALMRNGVTFLIKDLRQALEAAREQALTTHKNPKGWQCCVLHTFIGWSFINEKNVGADGFVELRYIEQILDQMTGGNTSAEVLQLMRSEAPWDWRAPQLKLSELTLRGFVGSDTVDCMAIALHNLFNGSPESIQDIATMGGDTDSNAAIFGALAGAKWGIGSFKQNWISGVVRFDDLDYVAARFLGVIDRVGK